MPIERKIIVDKRIYDALQEIAKNDNVSIDTLIEEGLRDLARLVASKIPLGKIRSADEDTRMVFLTALQEKTTVGNYYNYLFED